MPTALSSELLQELTAFRHKLHRQPGLAFDVAHSSMAIADRLELAGLAVTRNVSENGVVATLSRNTTGDENARRSIGFRADLDALPITEANEFEHRSRQPEKFHGCGHDGHSTMLLGAALQLAEDPSFSGTVHFIFQPDEENGTGADAMIADGLFDRFPMEAVYGLHNLPGLAVGHFAIQAGPFCSFEDNFRIVINGRGGHASMPERAIDPIVIGAEIVLSLQTIVSRSIPPRDHAVVSVTDFQTDGARNILASKVTISGDCRGFDKETSELIERRMKKIVNAACGAYGASNTVDYHTSFVPLINHAQATALCVDAVAQIPEATVDAAYGRVGFSEDFAKMLQQKPGAYILMGNGVDGPHHAQTLHNPNYDFNDEGLAYGVAYWCALATCG